MPVAGRRQILADQALARAAGAPLVGGNAVRVLADAEQNYPAWLDAIAHAERYIHFDSYALYGDRIGTRFADALVERAAAGVRVRVLYDWLGAFNKTPRAYWRRLQAAGIEVRPFNPPSLARPLAWLARDHRKMLAVDGRVAFVSGLCVGDDWVGRGATPPWRDTGVEIAGPAVADVHAAFAEIWAAAGARLPEDERPDGAASISRGQVAVRVIGSSPAEANMLRLDVLISSLARERLWIADAYFVGMPHYVQALTAAAADGVDVRLLVPGASDLPFVRSFSRAGYRGLLESGIRVFEWNGSMMHAKTAVADGQWARIGSTNLNLQSWMGNWELDVAVEDAGVGAVMEAMFERDLGNATEVVIEPARHRVQVASGASPARARSLRHAFARRGRTSRTAAGALRIRNAVGAALTATRPLGATEAPLLVLGGSLLLGLGGLAVWRPAWLAYPVAVLAVWLGLGLIGAAGRSWWTGRGR